MSDTIITVSGLGKKYRIQHQGEKQRYTALRDVIAEKAENLFRRRKAETTKCNTVEDFWALKDVSFEVKRGDVVGIIGRNGAGKSTLLKVLSRITEPTTGRVHLKGRVASLLEVGTGFHPELTGRENIFLNGAILGMSRAEIRQKFDEIVVFAEVEKFLDTPVKRYSSGMYVRLAFAVAAHLEPEILIVDEVLAVGDAQFQKKCLGKMQDVASNGRTVLFVSHNMNAIDSFCRRVVHLDKGRVCNVSDDVPQAVANYMTVETDSSQGCDWRNPGQALNNPWFEPQRLYLGDEGGAVVQMPIRNDEPFFVYIEGNVEQPDNALQIGYALYDEGGSLLYWTVSTDTAEDEWPRLNIGRNAIRSPLPMRLLNQGSYRLELLAALYHRQWISCPGSTPAAIGISIQGGMSVSPYWMEKRPGQIAPVCTWKAITPPNGNPIANSHAKEPTGTANRR